MDKITIICAVAVEFSNKEGERFNVGPKDLNVILQAPAWIQHTRMFGMLLADGSLKAVTQMNRVQLENNPTLGLNAEGKAVDLRPEEEAETDLKEEKKPRTARKPKSKPKTEQAGT